MIFLPSLLFALLFLPLEPAFIALAATVPHTPYPLALVGLNVGLYLLIFASLRASRMVYEDFRLGEKQVEGVQLRDWLEVNRCRWLNVLGLVGISAGAVLVFLAGRMPLPFWFLYAAVIIGLLDVMKRKRLVAVRSDLPSPRFDISATTPLGDGQGSKVEFRWHPWPSESGVPAQELAETFVIDQEAYQRARTAPRLPADKLENFRHYVLDEFTQSVQQVAVHFRRQSEQKEFTELEEVGNVVCFTRSIPYASDQDTHGVSDYANYSIETLNDKAGDCEDHAIFAAAILYYLGHDVAFFFLRFTDAGHAALGYNTPKGSGPFSCRANNGNEYYYVETVPTAGFDQIGEISEEFLKNIKECAVIPIG